MKRKKTNSTTGKLVQKFKDTGSMLDKHFCELSSISNKMNETGIAMAVASPKRSTCQRFKELELPAELYKRVPRYMPFNRT